MSTSLVYFFLFFSGYYIGLNKVNSKEKFIHTSFILYFIINGVTSYCLASILTGFFNNTSEVGFIFESGIFVLIYTINSFILKDSEPELIKNTIYRLAGKN